MRFFKLLLILIILTIILSFFNYQGWLNKPKSLFFTILSPFQKFFYFISNKVFNFFHLLGSIAEINQENNILQKENKNLLKKLI